MTDLADMFARVRQLDSTLRIIALKERVAVLRQRVPEDPRLFHLAELLRVYHCENPIRGFHGHFAGCADEGSGNTAFHQHDILKAIPSLKDETAHFHHSSQPDSKYKSVADHQAKIRSAQVKATRGASSLTASDRQQLTNLQERLQTRIATLQTIHDNPTTVKSSVYKLAIKELKTRQNELTIVQSHLGRVSMAPLATRPFLETPPLDRIAENMHRIGDLNPNGASHEFYASTVDGKEYFLRPMEADGVAAASLAYSEAHRLGLEAYVSPSWGVEHQGRTFQVMPMIPGDQMDHSSPEAIKSALDAIDPVTQAKLGLYHVLLGMADVAGNNVMLTPDGKLITIDTGEILHGIGVTPVMLDAYFGQSLELPTIKGPLSGKASDALAAKIRKTPIPPQAIDWLRSHVLSHQEEILAHIEHIAKIGDPTKPDYWPYYMRTMSSAMVRMAALRQISNESHPTWGSLESIVWWKNGKYVPRSLFSTVDDMGDYAWDHPAYTIAEVDAALRLHGVNITPTGISYQYHDPEAS